MTPAILYGAGPVFYLLILAIALVVAVFAIRILANLQRRHRSATQSRQPQRKLPVGTKDPSKFPTLAPIRRRHPR